MDVQFGWAIVNGKCVPNEEEQAVLRAIRECRSAGMSYRQIYQLLKDKGIVGNGSMCHLHASEYDSSGFW